MPGPKRPGYILYNGVWIPENTPMQPTTYVNPDGSKVTVMKPVQDKQLHTSYVEKRDKQYLFAHPHSGGISPNAPYAGNRLETSDSTMVNNQQMDVSKGYNSINGFGRNNKSRKR